jgi:hypothetical protein
MLRLRPAKLNSVSTSTSSAAAKRTMTSSLGGPCSAFSMRDRLPGLIGTRWATSR